MFGALPDDPHPEHFGTPPRKPAELVIEGAGERARVSVTWEKKRAGSLYVVQLAVPAEIWPAGAKVFIELTPGGKLAMRRYAASDALGCSG